MLKTCLLAWVAPLPYIALKVLPLILPPVPLDTIALALLTDKRVLLARTTMTKAQKHWLIVFHALQLARFALAPLKSHQLTALPDTIATWLQTGRQEQHALRANTTQPQARLLLATVQHVLLPSIAPRLLTTPM